MAPEVILNKTRDSKSSDIWSFGCFMLELINGEPPWYNLGLLLEDLIKFIAFRKGYLKSSFRYV